MPVNPKWRKRRRDDESEKVLFKAVASFLVAICAILLAAMASTMARAAPLDVIPDAVLGKAGFATPNGAPVSATNQAGPLAVAEDPKSGELWVADYAASRVLRYASSRAFANGEAANLVLGQADFASTLPNRGGAVAANTLNHPAGLAVDETGRLHVADTDNHRVLVYQPPYANGMNAKWVAGQFGMNQNAINRGLAMVTAGGMAFPQGIALDRDGRLWVTDSFNSRVIRFSQPLWANGLNANAVLGQASLDTFQFVVSAAGMLRPSGVAVDSDGNVWVADFAANRVTRYASPPQGSAGQAANLVLCQADFVSSLAGVTERTCNEPTGVAVDASGAVHVADFGNNRVLTFGLPGPGAAAATWAGQAGPNDQLCNRNAAQPSQETLCQPRQVAVDRHGNLLVVDGGNGRVLRYDSPLARDKAVLVNASPEAIAAGSGDFDLAVNGARFFDDSVVHWNGTPRPTRFVSPRRLVARIAAADVAAAGGADLTVVTPGPPDLTSASLNVAIYDRRAGDALADRVLGQPSLQQDIAYNPRAGGEGQGNGNPARLSGRARAVAIDPVTGRVFLADELGRVLSWPSLAGFRNGESADAVIGRPDPYQLGCDSSALSATTMCDPNGLVVDAGGRLYVSEPTRSRVVRFDPPFRTGMAASRVFGQGGSFTTFTPNRGGINADGLNRPSGLATGGNRLFVHDSENRRVLVFDDPDADTTADAVIGQPDFATAAMQPPSATSLGAGENGLATDAEGRLYVADANNGRVLRFSPPFTNGMAADLVIGQADFTSVAAGPTASRLSAPRALAIDAEGNLLVTDTQDHRVLRFQAPLATGMAASAVLGQPDFVSGRAGVGPDRLKAPGGVAVDGGGNVLVSDGGNARLLAFDRPFGASVIQLSVTSLLFGGQSMNTTALSQAVTLTNGGGVPIAISSVTVSTYFAVTHNCAMVPAGASCTANVSFTPTAEGALNGTLTLNSSAGNVTVPLFGVGERSLVTHYYRAILRRAPDAGGKGFWEAERARMLGLGANVNETWYAMATFFYFSSEYRSFNRDDAGFVTDLYNTFFNRAPDAGGLAFWTGQLAQGMPREVVLVSFMFSNEFRAFTQAIFGNVAARKEVDTVGDFYRGLLSRLPDGGGFSGWVGQFRAAQCQGAGAVYATVEAISSGFANSGEYGARNRTDAQYVGDLYNAFLRRGGDLGGVQFWINEIAAGTRSRSRVRQDFIASPEFTHRVAAIIAEGCVP